MNSKEAKWIWLGEEKACNAYVDFLRPFTVDSLEAPVELQVSAHSHYVAYVNGEHLPISQYGDYAEYKVYDTLDIRPWLNEGRNVLAIVGYCQGEDSLCCRQEQAGLWFAIKSDGKYLATADEKTLCRRSVDYASGEMERISAQLSFSFRYDARRADGWMLSDYVADDTWSAATVLPLSYTLFPRPIKDLRFEPCRPARIIAQGVFVDKEKDAPCGARMQHAFLSSRFSQELGAPEEDLYLPTEEGFPFASNEGDGMYFLVDLGGEEAGLLNLDLDLPQDATILVGFGEHLDDLRVRAEVGGRQFAAVYEGKSGRQQFTHYFKRFGCRYLQVHVYAPSCTVYYAGLVPTPYPLTQRPPFRSSDELHNRIEEVCRRTLELCMHEHYEDCPWREQGLYAMDSRNQMLFGYFAFGESQFAQESLRLLAMSLREDGLLELCAPSRFFVTIPSFTLNFVIAVEENVRFSKDVAFARAMLPAVEKIMEAFLGRRDATGLMPRFPEKPYWNFYEWTDGLTGVFDGSMSCLEGAETEWDVPLNAWFILALKAAAALQRVAGEEAKAAAYEQAEAEMTAALRNFWDEEKGVYASFYSKSKGYYHYAELTQALLLCGGVPTQSQQTVMRQKLADTDNGLVTISLSQSLLKYDALMADAATYGTFVKEEIGRIWGGMLYRGATSFWEVAEGADLFDRAGSLCHGWSAVPLYFYHHYVLGENLDGSQSAPAPCGLQA